MVGNRPAQPTPLLPGFGIAVAGDFICFPATRIGWGSRSDAPFSSGNFSSSPIAAIAGRNLLDLRPQHLNVSPSCQPYNPKLIGVLGDNIQRLSTNGGAERVIAFTVTRAVTIKSTITINRFCLILSNLGILSTAIWVEYHDYKGGHCPAPCQTISGQCPTCLHWLFVYSTKVNLC